MHSSDKTSNGNSEERGIISSKCDQKGLCKIPTLKWDFVRLI